MAISQEIAGDRLSEAEHDLARRCARYDHWTYRGTNWNESCVIAAWPVSPRCVPNSTLAMENKNALTAGVSCVLFSGS